MKTVYIHIGREKTGTTSIQNFLALNFEVLKKRGFMYPIKENALYTYWNQHVPIVASLTEKKIFAIGEKNILNKRPLEQLCIDINRSNCQNIIISSEYLNSMDKQYIKQLREYFSNYICIIIIYLRRYDEFLLSNAQERMKIGRDNTYYLERYKNHKQLYSYELINNWADIFGKDNIRVKVFEKSKFYKNNLYADFLKELGIEIDDTFVIPEKLNQSMSVEKFQFLNKISKYMCPYNSGEEKSFLHQKIRDYWINSDLFSEGKIKDLLSFDMRMKVCSYFKEDIDKIKKEFFNKKNEVFSMPNRDKYIDNKYPDMTNEKFMNNIILAIEDIFIKLDKYSKILDRYLIELRKSNIISNKQINYEYNTIKENNLLDVDYYLKRYDDVKKAGADPIMHYIKYGWYECRNPRKDFDTKNYILQNLEILDNNINPLVYKYLL